MPIITTQDGKTSAVTAKGAAKSLKKNGIAATPAFFNKTVLTGNGKTRGLLTELRNPKFVYPAGYHVYVNDSCTTAKHVNGDTTVYDIPFYMIQPSGWLRFVQTFEPDPMTTKTKIASNMNGDSVYIDIPIHAAQVEEKKVQNGDKMSTLKDLSVCFHMFLFFEADPACASFEQATSIPTRTKKNMFMQKISHDLYGDLRDITDRLEAAGYIVDKTVLNDYFRNYDLYTEISKAADRIMNHADKYVVDVLAKNLMGAQANYYNPYEQLNSVLARLEEYDIPIQLYNDMYHKMLTVVPADKLKDACRSNLNLMLADTLHNMDQNRANLEFCPNNVPLNQTKTALPYSVEQTNAIESTSPLTLVQSGAGTGKSTIILGRIQHMIDNGIDPKTILVLSFTNNAADNILDKNPTVNSMTIDKMMRLIYMENYPTHQLSSISTIINSLHIYYDPATRPMTLAEKDFIQAFSRILQKLRDAKEYTEALNFISDHTKEVIDALNTIEQTSLELQGIICYLNMATLREPPETYAKHLIIDEVQDNSIAQFIYCIGYTEKHNNSMYIVGDCSQTLYEFRGSNPRALNMLEASGVFDTYKLQTNYRSNQSILDFANIYLSNIDANRFANIKLHANSLAQTTPADFKKAVTVTYSKMPNKSEETWAAMFEASMRGAKDWISEKINKGEQVAILAYKKVHLDKMEENLLKMFPTCPAIEKGTRNVKKDANGNAIQETTRLVSLTSARQYDNTVFSSFISKFWNTIKYAPPTDIISTIECEMLAHAADIAFRKSNVAVVQKIITNTIADFRRECGGRISSLQRSVQASTISQKTMLDDVRKIMISYEIAKNSIAQAVMSSRNNEARNTEARENAHFIKSTIHAAKGLEFNNCIIFYDGASDANMDEDEKRLYYVALTRAKDCEYIISADRLAKPQIMANYDRCVAMLEAIEAATLAGKMPDADAADVDRDTDNTTEDCD